MKRLWIVAAVGAAVSAANAVFGLIDRDPWAIGLGITSAVSLLAVALVTRRKAR